MQTLSGFVKESMTVNESSNSYIYVWDTQSDFNNTTLPANLQKEDYINAIMKVIGWRASNESILRLFIGNAFDAWQNEYHLSKTNIPFRFTSNPKNLKLARCYADHDSLLGSRRTANIGGVKVIIGNGLGHGQGGYKFEADALGGICQYMVNGCSVEGLSVSAPVLSMLRHIDESALKVKLAECYRFYCSTNNNISPATPVDEVVKALEKYCYQTGESANKRGIDNVLQTKDIKVDRDGTESIQTVMDTRKASGQIISDIDLNTGTGENIHISIKEGRAQLSGVVVSPSAAGKWIEHVLDASAAGEDYDEVVKGRMGTQFVDFFTAIGVNPRSVFDQWKNRGTTDTLPLRLTDSNNYALCATIIHNIIGGNYWYVSPKKCLWVPYEDMGGEFIPKNAYMTGSGKGITVVGSIGDCAVKIVVRDARGTGYPTRMFPIVNVDEWLKAVGVK